MILSGCWICWSADPIALSAVPIWVVGLFRKSCLARWSVYGVHWCACGVSQRSLSHRCANHGGLGWIARVWHAGRLLLDRKLGLARTRAMSRPRMSATSWPNWRRYIRRRNDWPRTSSPSRSRVFGWRSMSRNRPRSSATNRNPSSPRRPMNPSRSSTGTSHRRCRSSSRRCSSGDSSAGSLVCFRSSDASTGRAGSWAAGAKSRSSVAGDDVCLAPAPLA